MIAALPALPRSPLMALTFAAPGRLWLLLLVAALGVGHVIAQRRAGRYTVRFTNLDLLDSLAPERPGWRRHLPAALLLLGLAGLVGGFARPLHEERVPQERATIIVAIDTSLSMAATDVAPTRIDAAQAAAKDFIGVLPTDLNVGLVTFNGTATIAVPPTLDHEQLLAAIDQIRLGERTAIGEAIYASLDAIHGSAPFVTDTDGDSDGDGDGDENEIPARIVLMSDGATTVGRPDAEAAAQAKRDGIPVSTIAFGTPHGTIELEGYHDPVPVEVDIPALQEIAMTTGGSFFEAVTEEQLKAVYADIGSSIGYTTEERDISERFVGASLVVLLLAAAGSQLWFSRLP